MLKRVISKSTVLATITALALASLSATGVLAASQVHSSAVRSADQNLASQWKAELTDLNRDKFTDHSIGKWNTEWLETKRSSTDVSTRNRYIEKAALELKQAESIASKHAGFDSKGNVINRALAAQTIQNLSTDLNLFHMDMMDKVRVLFR